MVKCLYFLGYWWYLSDEPMIPQGPRLDSNRYDDAFDFMAWLTDEEKENVGDELHNSAFDFWDNPEDEIYDKY